MKHNITAIKIGDCDIIPSASARNIGVVFDAEMSMACHVHETCRACYHLKNVASIRSCMREQAAIRLVHSVVVSRSLFCSVFPTFSSGVFDWASSVTYVLTDWTFLTILYSTGTGNEAM